MDEPATAEVVLKDLTSDAERAEVLELLEGAFGTSVHGDNLRFSVWDTRVGPPSGTKLAIVDGVVAAVIVVGRRSITFPPVSLDAATIGPVATRPNFQRRGIVSKLMEYTLQSIASSNQRLAYIQGIPNFYSRFGFYPYLAKSKARIQVTDVPSTVDGALVALEPCHIPALRAIFSRVNSDVVCSAQRGDAVWAWLTGPATRSYYFYAPRVFLGADGSVAGYVTFDSVDPLNFREIVVDSNMASCELALALLRDYAVSKGATEFEIKIPYEAYLMTYLRQRLRGVFFQYFQADGGALMKVIDLTALLRELRPYFAQRLKGVGLADAALTICAMGQNFTLQTRGGEFEIGRGPHCANLTVGDEVVPGLLTGYYSFEHLAPFSAAKLSTAEEVLARHLFPAKFPFVYQGDNY